MSTPLRSLLTQVVSDLDAVLSGDALAGVGEAERVEILVAAGAVLRRAEAVVVETVSTGDGVDFPHSAGCRSQNELVQRAVRTDVAGATRFGKVIDLVDRELNLSSGERMPADWPALRDALLDGEISVAGMLAATKPLVKISHRMSMEQRLEADELLARAARGVRIDDPEGEDETGDDDTGPALTPEDLRILAQAIARSIDPDGTEPGDDPARRRGLTLGRVRDGLRQISGHLTPDVAAQLELLFDAYNNPKGDGPPQPGGVRFTVDDDGVIDGTDADADVDVDGDVPGSACDDRAEDPFNTDPRCVLDDRTASQKRHDAFAAILGIAARHDSAPTIGGAAPTLVVTVDAKDLADGSGWADVPGAFGHLPARVAAHVGCTGTIQRVLFDEGRIIGISTTNRVFTVHQRRAIIARDKECLIPGCHVPASWCEIHHVTEHSQGGPTHTDNGVPLCWWHHRSLGTSGWEIRMNQGRPEVRGPAWWDPAQKWRTPTLSLPDRALALRRRKIRRGRGAAPPVTLRR